MQRDLPYYVIGGENWDMRTIHIADNGCIECHRIGMGTAKLFIGHGWDPNKHMTPKSPGSLSEDWKALLECWENGPENTPGCEWVIPPTGDSLGRVVGDDYPYKAAFNQPGREALDQPVVGSFKEKFGKALGGDKAGDGKAHGDEAFHRPRRKGPSRP